LSILLPNLARNLSVRKMQFKWQPVLTALLILVIFLLFFVFFYWSRLAIIAA
jgi:hypothetical protein